jgi:ribosome-binding factor A
LQETLLRELRSLLRDDVSDPALEDVFAVSVELSADGRHLRVHLIAASDGVLSTSALERALRRVTPFLRHRLALDLDLKRTPELRLVLHAAFS